MNETSPEIPLVYRHAKDLLDEMITAQRMIPTQVYDLLSRTTDQRSVACENMPLSIVVFDHTKIPI